MSAPPPTLEEISSALAVVMAPIAAQVETLATQVQKIDRDLAALTTRVDTMELSFTSRLDGFIATTNANFVHVIARLDGIDARLEGIDAGLEALQDTRITLLEQRVAALEGKRAS